MATTVNDFLQLIYWALSQRWANIFISPTNTLKAVDLAVKDILNYEWINWAFQLRTDDTFSTDWTSSKFVHTIPTSSTEYVRRVVYVAMNGSDVGKLKVKAINKIDNSSEVFFRFWDSTVTVFDHVWQPLNYELAYFVGYKSLTSLDQTLPIPDFFLPALFDFTMSYLMLPFGQYWEGKDQNFYQRATEKMAWVLKSNSSQSSNLVIKID